MSENERRRLINFIIIRSIKKEFFSHNSKQKVILKVHKMKRDSLNI